MFRRQVSGFETDPISYAGPQKVTTYLEEIKKDTIFVVSHSGLAPRAGRQTSSLRVQRPQFERNSWSVRRSFLLNFNSVWRMADASRG